MFTATSKDVITASAYETLLSQFVIELQEVYALQGQKETDKNLLALADQMLCELYKINKSTVSQEEYAFGLVCEKNIFLLNGLQEEAATFAAQKRLLAQGLVPEKQSYWNNI